MSEVNDRPAERGILIGNVLSGAILAAIVWVGNTILDLKDELAKVTSRQAVNVEVINSHERRLDDHEGRIRRLEKP